MRQWFHYKWRFFNYELKITNYGFFNYELRITNYVFFNYELKITDYDIEARNSTLNLVIRNSSFDINIRH